MQINPINVNCDAPANDELIVSPSAEQTASNMAFIRREGRNRRVRFLKRSGNATKPFIDAAIDPASVVSMAIGTPDLPPTSGTFSLSYDSEDAHLEGLAYNVSAATLETEMNLNSGVSAAGGVTVASAGNGAWLVTFNDEGVRELFVNSANALVPISTYNVIRVVTGSVSVAEVQLITLRQNYLAVSNDFAPVADGSIAADHVQTGDASKPDVYRIAIDGAVNGGTWLLTSTQAQTLLITPQANVTPGLVNAKWNFSQFITPVAATFANIAGTYVDLEDEVGPVRFYARINGAGAVPVVPPGGRIVAVPLTDPNPDPTNLDDAHYISYAFSQGIIADSKFRAFPGSPTFDFTIEATTPGQRSIGAVGIGIIRVALDQVAGDGPYQSSYFSIGDANGTVGIWFNVSTRGIRPAAVDAFDRVIEVTTVTPGMSAVNVGTALQTILDADSQFAATLSGAQVTVTQASAGARSLPSNGTAPLGVAQTRVGRTIASVFRWDSTAGQIQQFIGDTYTVTSEATGIWNFVALANGVSAALTVNGDGLLFAAIWEGTFVLSTVNLFLAFAALPAGTSITSKFEIQIIEPGGNPAKVYQGDCEIRADVIDANNLVTPGDPNPSNQITFLSSVTGLTGGGSSNLDGTATAGVTVPRMYAFRDSTGQIQFYELIAGTSAEDSPFVIRPDDYAGGSNEKIFTASSLGAPVVVADATARNARAPQFVGQLLFQTDTGQYYRADGVTAGEWTSAIQLDGLLLAGDTTHVSQLFAQAGVSPSLNLPAASGVLALVPDFTNAGSTGAQTINKHAGSVQFAAAATTLVVTNSLVTTTSNIGISLLTADATAVLGSVVPAAGSFTISMKVAPTGTTRVGFQIVVP